MSLFLIYDQYEEKDSFTKIVIAVNIINLAFLLIIPIIVGLYYMIKKNKTNDLIKPILENDNNNKNDNITNKALFSVDNNEKYTPINNDNFNNNNDNNPDNNVNPIVLNINENNNSEMITDMQNINTNYDLPTKEEVDNQTKK